MSVDPITGLPLGDDSSQETSSSVPRRPQSPLVRGTHLDKSVDRFKKRPNISSQVDNGQAQLPAKRGELQGLIPPAHDVLRPKDKLEHMIDSIQCVIDGNEQLVSEEELLLAHPLNLEKTRFSMSKKKLKLPFMDDVLDRFEDERWMYPDQFERRRKLWSKSVARSIKFIDKFLDKEPSDGDYVRPQNQDESFGNTTMGSASTHASAQRAGRGIPKEEEAKSAAVTSVAPKKRGRKAKESSVEDGLAAVSKLTLPAPTKKIPKKSNAKESKPATSSGDAPSKIPTFGRKKKGLGNADCPEKNVGDKEKKKRGKKKASDNEDCDASSPKKSKNDRDEECANTKKAPASKAKKPAFGAPKRGKKGAVSAEKNAIEEVPCAASSVADGDGEQMEQEKGSSVIQELVEETGGKMETSQKNEIEKAFEVYENIDEDEEPVVMRSQKAASQSVMIPVIPATIGDDGMETDDEEWEPNDAPRELTPPRGLLPLSQDAYLLPPAPSSYISHSSQSIFGSLSSSLMGSPNTSFSSQSSSSILAPAKDPSFSLSSSLLPSQPLATSTQIPMSQQLVKEEGSEKNEKKPTSSGPRVRPTFGKKK